MKRKFFIVLAALSFFSVNVFANEASYTLLKSIKLEGRTESFVNSTKFQNTMAIGEKLAYVSEFGTGVKIFDIEKPENPKLLDGALGDVKHATMMKIIGDRMYVAEHKQGIKIFDITKDPKNPKQVGVIQTEAPKDITVAEKKGKLLVYVADSRDGMLIFDITNPGNPLLVGKTEIKHARWIDIVKNTVYVMSTVTGESILKVVDVTNSKKPTIIKEMSIDTYFGAVMAIDGNRLFLGHKKYLISVFDITNPKELQSIETVHVGEDSPIITRITKHGDSIYVTRNGVVDELSITEEKVLLYPKIKAQQAIHKAVVVGNFAYTISNGWLEVFYDKNFKYSLERFLNFFEKDTSSFGEIKNVWIEIAKTGNIDVNKAIIYNLLERNDDKCTAALVSILKKAFSEHFKYDLFEQPSE